VTAQKATTKKNEFEKALVEFTKAVKVFLKKDDEKSKEALTAFVQVFSEEKELVDRAKIYLEIVESRLHPPKITLKTAEDYYVNGIFEMNQGVLDDALNSFEKALSKDPKQGKILYAMADASCLKGEIDGSLEYLQQAVKLDTRFSTLAQNEADFDPIKKDQRFFDIINPE
jgi:tetratricopeptide (TPR) repeat protein